MRETKPSLQGLAQPFRKGWVALMMLSLGIGFSFFWTAQPHVPSSISIELNQIPVLPPPAKIAARQSKVLQDQFAAAGYRLQDIKLQNITVPRIWPDMVPDDLAKITHIPDRKSLFIRMVLPLALMANEKIIQDREKLLDLVQAHKNGEPLLPSDINFLARLTKKYNTKADDYNELIKRVDILPVSLTLAQAAIESGWGTSRFAREGNALFGQWTSNKFEGLVPLKREEGKNHKIRAFPTPLEAVQSYILNINTHRAYRGLRNLRANLRHEKLRLDGEILADGLESYSEKGASYVELVRHIIQFNDLSPLDRSRLSDQGFASAKHPA